MPTVTANGIDIYYERSGSGPKLLFCNGSGSTLATSGPLISLFTPHFDVVAHDQRGLGRTSIPEGPYSMADYAADAAAVLDAVGWERCRVAGISFGGMVAQEFAVTWPQRVERLALLCTSPGGDAGASYPLHELDGLDAAERAAIGTRLLDTRFTPEWLAAHAGDQALVEMMAQRGTGPKSADQLRGEREQLDARSRHDVTTRVGRDHLPDARRVGSLRRHRAAGERRSDRGTGSGCRAPDVRRWARVHRARSRGTHRHHELPRGAALERRGADEVQRGVDAREVARRLEVIDAAQRHEARVGKRVEQRLGRTGEVLVAEDDEHGARHPRDFLGGQWSGRAPETRGHRERIVAGFGREAHEHARRDLIVISTLFERGCQALGAVGAEHVGAGTDHDETPEPARIRRGQAEQQLRAEREADRVDGVGGQRRTDARSRSVYAAGSCGRAAVP